MDTEIFYYISFFDKASYSLRYPNDIEMENLLNHDIAMMYYNFNVINDFENIIDVQPILITNNSNLYKQYRHIVSGEDFYAFCNDKLESYRCLSGLIGEQAFEHFLNIKKGIYNRVHQSRNTEIWDDTQSGYSYEFETNEGWTTSNTLFISATIENNLKQRNNLSKL